MESKSKKYWTKERCFSEFRKHNTKKDFVDNCPGAFTAMRRNGWIKEVWHELDNKIGNMVLRCVYVYEFKDNHAYIGLTSNIEKRNNSHQKIKSPVGRHILKTSQKPKLIKLTDYIDVNEAVKIEIETIEKYRKNKWKLLNNTLGGETGCSVLFWDKEACFAAAKKCKTKNEFLKKFHGAWSSAKNHNWLHEIHELFPDLKKPRGYWTKENCQIEALKYDMKEKFRKGSSSAYTMSIKNNWFNEITKHMK